MTFIISLSSNVFHVYRRLIKSVVVAHKRGDELRQLIYDFYEFSIQFFFSSFFISLLRFVAPKSFCVLCLPNVTAKEQKRENERRKPVDEETEKMSHGTEVNTGYEYDR